MYSVFAASPLAVQVDGPHLNVLDLAFCMTLEICKSYEKAAFQSSFDLVNANVMADEFRLIGRPSTAAEVRIMVKLLFGLQ